MVFHFYAQFITIDCFFIFVPSVIHLLLRSVPPRFFTFSLFPSSTQGVILWLLCFFPIYVFFSGCLVLGWLCWVFFQGCSPLFFGFFCCMFAFMFCGSLLCPFISSCLCFIMCVFGFFLTLLFYLRPFPFVLQFSLLRCSLWLWGVKVIPSHIGINFGLAFLLVVNFWEINPLFSV